jgi:pilus assembly protein CpaB
VVRRHEPDTTATGRGDVVNRNAAFGALIAAALGAILLILYLRRFEAEKSGGDPVKVLVTTKAVPRGKPLTEDMLSVRDIPIAYVDARMIKAAERDKVVGLRTFAPLEAQNVVMWNDLAVSAEEHRDLSSLVTPGFRAVYIRAMREDQGAPLISPGDYVDVIATLPQASDGRGDRNTAVVLLQKVLVLASGGKTSPDEPSGPSDKRTPVQREDGLTLSLSLQAAQLIALASERGHFSVALRSPDDPRTIDGIPDMTEVTLTGHGGPTAQVSARLTGPIKLKDGLIGGVPR